MNTPIRTQPAGTPSAPAFIHLKVHSAYSLLEGAIQIPKLAKLAEAHGMPALSLTDTNNLFQIWTIEFREKWDIANELDCFAKISL